MQDSWTLDSMKDWSIWMSDPTDPAQAHAAEEWQQFFKEATGQSLTMDQSSSLESHALWISDDPGLSPQILSNQIKMSPLVRKIITGWPTKGGFSFKEEALEG